MKLRLVVALLMLNAWSIACGTIRIPTTQPTPPPLPPVVEVVPVPVPMTAIDLVGCRNEPVDNYCDGPSGVQFEINTGPDQFLTVVSDGNGYVFVQNIPQGLDNTYIIITAKGYQPLIWNTTIPKLVANNQAGRHNMVLLVPNPTADFDDFPHTQLAQALTREQILNLKITGQGLVVQTQQFGQLPWWEAALTYLDKADRAAVYAAKHASTAWAGGDTHAILAVPSGRALYDEPGQPYSADRFPPLDWTNGGTKMAPQFDLLVLELINNGFVPMIFLDETESTSERTLPLVINALQHSPAGDLTPYVLIGPGWDGVFYGWEPSHVVIPAWASLARASCPKCYLFIEHNVGHIPVGEGPSDWRPDGLMNGFDLLLSEFFDNQFDDSVWQIAGRTIRPYHRPADQPTTDDPNPPFYLEAGSTRGPFRACAFEFAMFGYVRGRWTPEQVNGMRDYFKQLGYTCGG